MARSADIVTEMLEDMLMDTSTQGVIVEEDLVSENSYQEAIQVLQVWQQEEADEDTPMSGVADEDDDDVIMQLDADEGLLPTLNDFYDSISADTCPPEELLADAVITDSSSTENSDSDDSTSSDSFLSLEEEDDDESKDETTRAFQETLQKLAESMKRSQETRQSLYAQTPKLQDYQRLGSVEKVLRSIEFSSYQIDSYCKTLRTTTL
jgi:hypothetical protein